MLEDTNSLDGAHLIIKQLNEDWFCKGTKYMGKLIVKLQSCS